MGRAIIDLMKQPHVQQAVVHLINNYKLLFKSNND